jgi:hypothetical protein
MNVGQQTQRQKQRQYSTMTANGTLHALHRATRHGRSAAVLSLPVGYDAPGGGCQRLHCCPIRIHPRATRSRHRCLLAGHSNTLRWVLT